MITFLQHNIDAEMNKIQLNLKLLSGIMNFLIREHKYYVVNLGNFTIFLRNLYVKNI